MIKHFLIFIFCMIAINAKNIEADYSVEFAVVGEIAKAHAVLTANGAFCAI